MINFRIQPQPRWVGAVTCSRFPSKQHPGHKATLVRHRTWGGGGGGWELGEAVHLSGSRRTRCFVCGVLLRDRDEGLSKFTSKTGTLLDMRVYGDLYRASDSSPCPDVSAHIIVWQWRQSSAGCSMARQPLIQSPTTCFSSTSQQHCIPQADPTLCY